MKLGLGVIVAGLLLLLTGYVTVKAGWIGGKAEDAPTVLKTLHVQSNEQLEEVLNSTGGKYYRSGQSGNWKLAMVYR